MRYSAEESVGMCCVWKMSTVEISVEHLKRMQILGDNPRKIWNNQVVKSDFKSLSSMKLTEKHKQ